MKCDGNGAKVCLKNIGKKRTRPEAPTNRWNCLRTLEKSLSGKHNKTTVNYKRQINNLWLRLAELGKDRVRADATNS